MAYPDFLRNSTAAWWKEKIKELYTNPQEPMKRLKFDGLWIVSASLVGFLWKCWKYKHEEAIQKLAKQVAKAGGVKGRDAGTEWRFSDHREEQREL